MTSSLLESRVVEMGYSLPEARRFPSQNRQGCVRVGAVMFLSGHGPHHEGMDIRRRGKLGADVTIDEGRAAAEAAALSMLATLKDALGDLDRVRRVVRLMGMVNCTPLFEDMPLVIDGASDLLFVLFGPERGCHARLRSASQACPETNRSR